MAYYICLLGILCVDENTYLDITIDKEYFDETILANIAQNLAIADWTRAASALQVPTVTDSGRLFDVVARWGELIRRCLQQQAA